MEGSDAKKDDVESVKTSPEPQNTSGQDRVQQTPPTNDANPGNPDGIEATDPVPGTPEHSQGTAEPSLDAGSPYLGSPTNHPKAHLSSLSPNMAEFGRIPTVPQHAVGNDKLMPNRSSGKLRHPNQMPLVKLSTVTMTSKKRAPSSRAYYNNYVENRRPRKVITWDEATNARPPLRVDMDGPTACSYTPGIKPLYETNAPSFSFGRKTFVEKAGGSRTSWQKTWFQNEDVWTQKADFYSDRKWPSPPTHKQRSTVGGRLMSLRTAPQHTFGFKRSSVVEKRGAGEEPAPNDYNIARANTIILPKSPAYTHSLRRGGTCLWSYTEHTPGPGTYAPEKSCSRIKTHYPAFSIQGTRREKSHELGPYAAF